MELIEYTPENCMSAPGQVKSPVLGLNIKSGKLSFNQAAVEKLGINDQSLVKLLQDKKDPECWYLEVVKDGGFNIRQVVQGKYLATVVANKKLVTQIADSVNFNGKSGKILLAGQPTKLEKRTLWGLIVTTLNN